MREGDVPNSGISRFCVLPLCTPVPSVLKVAPESRAPRPASVILVKNSLWLVLNPEPPTVPLALPS